jgi:hypothetical protein
MITCPACLRIFPQVFVEGIHPVYETGCVFCHSLIHYAIVEPQIRLPQGTPAKGRSINSDASYGAPSRLGQGPAFILRGHTLLTTRAAWSLSLRTDSVNRAFCISRFKLEMIFFASSIRLFFIFIGGDTGRTEFFVS